MSAARQELLRRRLQGRASASADRVVEALRPRDTRTSAPASPAQVRLHFLDQLYDDGAAYHMVQHLALEGEVDEVRLAQALARVVERHPSLRTRFSMMEGELRQEIDASVPVVLEELEGQGDAAVRAFVNAPLSLRHGPVWRAGLRRVHAARRELVLVVHHIVADEWSMGLLLQELAHCYREGEVDPFEPLTVDYGDYVLWQRERVDARRTLELSYWREQLATAQGTGPLVTDRRRPSTPSLGGALRSRPLDVSLVQGLSALARQHHATPYMVSLAAYVALLHRYGGQRDICVGIPVASRTPAQAQALVGLFLNSLVVRAEVAPDEPFERLLDRVRDTVLAAFEYQTLPFEELVAALKPNRDAGANPLFQTMFVLESDPVGPVDFGHAIQYERLPFDAGHAKFDLTCFVRLEGAGPAVSIEYATDVFDGATVDALLEAYLEVLASVVATPRANVDALTLLSADAMTGERERSQGPSLAPPVHGTVMSLISRHRGEGAALVDGERRVSWDALRQQTATLARGLAARGIGPGSVVVIALPRGVEQVLALLGTLESGAAYVPLDRDYPVHRQRQIVAELKAYADAPLLIVGASAGDEFDVPAVSYEALLGEGVDASPVATRAQADDLAYVIYTSGSTGRAKGVAISHANLLASTLARYAHYGEEHGATMRYLLVSSFAFDSSVAGIFWTLASGGTLVMAAADDALDPRVLTHLIEREGVTHTLMLPALYDLILEVAGSDQLRSLRVVIVAGEACATQIPERHARRLGQVRLTNEYGPTEGTVWATAYDCEGAQMDRVPIGRPIAGTQAYVCDDHGRPVPRGAVGELQLAGAGVAVGYLGQPLLTDERFVTNAAGERRYRTGDRVRWRADDQLDYLGRVDDQLKLRGYRIEPAEIEGSLRGHPQVLDAAVTVIRDAQGARLIAWCVAARELPSSRELRAWLGHRLPAHLVPNQVLAVEEIPRLPNGKINRGALPQALPAPEQAIAPAQYADGVETELAALWREQLGLTTPAGPDEDFFELGGHSLLGVSLMVEIERRFGVALPLATLFETPRLADLAQRIREGRAPARIQHLIPIQANGTKAALICVHGGARQAAKHFGDEQPVYLAFTHLEQRDSERHSVQSMAERYLEEVRQLQPRGPYRLIGFSFGGKIAYEMACRLRQSGESVALALCDPPPPSGAAYYRQQWRARRADLAGRGPLAGIHMLRRVIAGRLRTWRLRLLDAYFSKTRRSSQAFIATAASLFVLGLSMWLGAGWALNQPEWRPASISLTPSATHEASFVVPEGGRLELTLEVDRAWPQARLREAVLATKRAAPLEVRWQVLAEGQPVATGDVEDYRYIDAGPRTLVGRLRRIALRVPFGQSERYFQSFGFAGLPTAERGVGALDSEAGTPYTLRVDTAQDLASIEALSPRLVVRLSRERFAAAYARSAPLAIAGMVIALLGSLVALVAFVRQRQSTPASLLAYRDRQHYRRMSARYRYPPYDGALTLLLPETYAVYRAETEDAWRQLASGAVQVELIEGVRRHADLINETGGERLGSAFGRWLEAAERREK